MVPPIQEQLESVQVKARSRFKTGGQAASIRKQCKQVAARLRNRGTSILTGHAWTQKSQWVSYITEGILNWLPIRLPFVEEKRGVHGRPVEGINTEPSSARNPKHISLSNGRRTLSEMIPRGARHILLQLKQRRQVKLILQRKFKYSKGAERERVSLAVQRYAAEMKRLLLYAQVSTLCT